MLRRLTFPEGFHSKFKNKVKEGVIILEDVIVENFPKMGKEIVTKSKKPRESQPAASGTLEASRWSRARWPPKCQKQGWASRPEFRVLALGLAADTRLLGKTARL